MGLALVLGVPAGEPAAADCELAEWTAPWGKSYRMCRDASTEIEIEHRDIHGFRIEDRQFGDQTRYFVTVRLANQFVDPLAETLRSAEKLYAVLVDGEVSVVLPGVAIGEQFSLVAVTDDLTRAEELTRRWDAPVDRVISAEIAALPMYSPSLIQLIATPERWAGKRVSVQGYLSSWPSLFVSREHAEAQDVSSAVRLAFVSEEGIRAASTCANHWVLMHGFVELDRGGLAELTHVERVWAFPDGPHCWPAE